MKTFDLYCGRNIGPDGVSGFVSDTALDNFLRGVAPQFPGFTVIHTVGYWRGISEPSFILRIIAPDADRPTISAVGHLYRTQFSQESVLLTETATGVTFLEKE